MPPVQNLTNHSYISPIDIIRNILGHGISLDKIETNVVEKEGSNYGRINSISESPRAQKKLENAEKRYNNDKNIIVFWMNE